VAQALWHSYSSRCGPKPQDLAAKNASAIREPAALVARRQIGRFAGAQRTTRLRAAIRLRSMYDG
jgi:hypothetical protein